jgi:hypothetical protein
VPPSSIADMSRCEFQHGQCPTHCYEFSLWSNGECYEGDGCLYESGSYGGVSVEYVEEFDNDGLGDNFVDGIDSNYSVSEDDEGEEVKDTRAGNGGHKGKIILQSSSEDEFSNYDSDGRDRVLVDSNVEMAYIDRFLIGKQFCPLGNGSVSLEKWMLFNVVHAFKAALKDYIIKEGFQIVRLKNEKRRVGEKCAVESCTCTIYASPIAYRFSYKIK